MKKAPFFILSILLFAGAIPALHAEEFYCEAMAVEGTVKVSNSTTSGKALVEGDLLKADDLIEVSSGSYVDLAYDREWNNITRVEEDSKVRLRSVYPTTLELETGGVFAKLKSLPKGSTFDVQTPTAIASVRGTEYRTTFLSGETQIYNVSSSEVYVYGFDDSGVKQAEPVVLKRSHTTQVQKRGVPPGQPRKMEEREFRPVKRSQEGITKKVQDNVSKGRFGKIQNIRTVERMYEEKNRLEEETQKGSGREKPKTMTGDEAHAAAQRIRGGEGPPRSGKEGLKSEDRPKGSGSGVLRSDEFSSRPPAEEGGKVDQSRDRSLGEPYFPGNEKQRGGGPEPVGFPEERWKSGAEKHEDTRGHNGLDGRHGQAQQGQGPRGDSPQAPRKESPQQKKPAQNRPAPRPQQRS